MNTQDTEAARWKAIALYLADCLAATAEQEAITKSVSQSRKKRHFEICRKAVSLIEDYGPVKGPLDFVVVCSFLL